MRASVTVTVTRLRGISGDIYLGPECAVDRCAIDAAVLVVGAVVGEQRVVHDSEVLKEGHMVEAHVPVRWPWRGAE